MTITAVVFDAYGTLFDTNAAFRKAAEDPSFPQIRAVWPKVSAAWRAKQLQYTWLRAVTGHHIDFWQVTKDALDWALEADDLTNPALREHLLALYWELETFPEVPRLLGDLKAAGLTTAILSNGSRDMLNGAVTSAGLEADLDALLSVDSVGVFKPSPQVYDLVQQTLGQRPDQVLFVSSNGWDVASAAAYGFQTLWVNRAGDPMDRLPATPDRTAPDLSAIPALLARDKAREEAPKTFGTSDGLTLAYRDEGDGPVLLCLCGLTRNLQDFDFVARDFSDRARVLRMDYRGRGGSDFDPDFGNYTLAREGRDALELLDHLGIDKAAILGTSRGGLIAMSLAASNKDRLAGACLVDIGPELNPGGLADIFGYLGLPPTVKTLEAGTDMLVERNGPLFPGVSRARWRLHADRIWRETPDGLGLRYDPRLRDALLAQTEASGDEVASDMWPLFDALGGVPIGLLRGQYSNLLREETAAEMRRRRPDMIFEQIANRGHVPFLDEPESRRGIAAFLGALG